MSDSSDEDHPYVKYGTPLQELDELSIKPSSLKSGVPVFEQVVTDEEGRRRFHGAFTGGFSAGYYNTVGTKEGWKPSEFKSSRSTKSDRKSFKAEDFMDEEDLGDFGIAPRMLSTKADFTSERKRNAIQEKQKKLQEDKLAFPLGNDVIESLVVPVRSNIGVKLLRNMGWREGQGLGPHVKKKKKKKTDIKSPPATKTYGCSLPRKAGDSDSDNEYVPEDFKFAPKDLMPISINVKDDHHGIGYSGLDPTAALHKKVKKSSAVKAKTKSGSKLSFFGQAFGVGAYEEEDDDIYAQDSMSNYDSIMGEERNPDSTYGWTRPRAITGGNTMEAIGFGETTKVFFVAAKKQSKLYPKVYPAPNLPADFDPNRRLRLRTGTQKIKEMNLPKQMPSQSLPPAAVAPPHHLTSQDRAVLLDGGKLDDGSSKKSQSVFDFISFEDRQKMEAAKQKPVELGHKDKSETIQEIPPETHIDKSSPLCKPQTLRPFSNNPEKFRRYNQYEEAVKQRKKDPYSSIQSNLTEWERKHERDEFARMAQVYLHLSNNINSKFTKSTEDTSEEVSTDRDAEPAAKMKMFGIMTHSVGEWHPDPLLCKRFNVPDPYPDSEHVGSSVPSGSKYLSYLPLTHEASSKPTKDGDKARVQELKNNSGIISDTVRPPMFEKSRPFTKRRWDKEPDFVGPLDRMPDDNADSNSTANQEMAQSKADTNEPTERPPMELFKSIFASSEEESSSDEDDDVTEAANSRESQAGISGSSEERKSAAEVFMKPIPITRDEAIPQPEPDDNKSNEMSPPSNQSQNNVQENKVDEECFGPVLPPVKLSNQTYNSESQCNRHKSHSKHKKHKKHDHKRKKKKHKS